MRKSKYVMIIDLGIEEILLDTLLQVFINSIIGRGQLPFDENLRLSSKTTGNKSILVFRAFFDDCIFGKRI